MESNLISLLSRVRYISYTVVVPAAYFLFTNQINKYVSVWPVCGHNASKNLMSIAISYMLLDWVGLDWDCVVVVSRCACCDIQMDTFFFVHIEVTLCVWQMCQYSTKTIISEHGFRYGQLYSQCECMTVAMVSGHENRSYREHCVVSFIFKN